MDGQNLQQTFTLSNYSEVLSNGPQVALLIRTCLTAVVVVAIVILICYPIAYYLVFRMRSATRVATTLTLVALPFLVGPLIRAIAWKGILGLQGVVNGLLETVGIIDDPIQWLLYSRFSVVLALVYNTYPFMLFALVLTLETVDKRLVAAARDLGSGAMTAFREVVLPLSIPGLLVGSLLTFVPAVSASIEPELLGGPESRFSANAITDKFLVAVDWPLGAALTVCFTTLAVITCLLLSVVLVLILRGRTMFRGRTS
ncbi:MAG: ABC transporter permease [Thermoleophilia bacterium]|nr:ABC transporter permease [Thermoleophilia bacterium]